MTSDKKRAMKETFKRKASNYHKKMISDKKRAEQNKRASLFFIDTMRSTKSNCVRLAAGNTEAHERMKFNICWQLTKERKEYMTEVYFKNGKRADIVVLDDLKVIEVLGTETADQVLEKVKGYPGDFEFVYVDASKEFNEELIY